MRAPSCVALLLSLVLPSKTRAQEPQASSAQLSAEIGHILSDLNAAAARGDWQAMRPFFPDSSAAARRVHEVLASGRNWKGLTFWAVDAQADFTHLLVTPFAQDLVAVQVPFTQRSNKGTFGAVFEKQAKGWVVRCFSDSFGFSPARPGCSPN